MHIHRIALKDYRCFASLSVLFHPQMTVLVAPNGQGKSAILDAIKVALWPFVAGFDLGSTTNDVTGIHIDDVRRESYGAHDMDWRLPSEIVAEGEVHATQLVFDGDLRGAVAALAVAGNDGTLQLPSALRWQSYRYRDSVRKATKTKDRPSHHASGLFEVATALQRRAFSDRGDRPDDLPMLGYYGTGRLWAQKKLTTPQRAVDSESRSRTFAYRDCLDPASSYKHFAVWFSRVHQAYLQAQIRNLERGLGLDANVPDDVGAPFRAVQNAIDRILGPHTGWHRLQYSVAHEELVLHHEQHGEFKVSQLSDGIRNMLALVGDIAYRCYKLNPHLGEKAAIRTSGIVLIDEVDMHLHPRWQQTVLTELMAAFPMLQFVVTTHSPQVLTSVDASCIRMLREETDATTGKRSTVIETVALQTKGVASSDLLAQIMGVDPVPDVPEARMLARYHTLIQQDLYEDEEGKSLRSRLDAHFGSAHPVLRDADRMIRLQEFKRRLPVGKRRGD